MLETPLGKIRILKNGIEVDYIEKQHTVNLPITEKNPLAGCFRIAVDFSENDTIICELDSNENLSKGNSGGEDYACKVFNKDKIELVIGSFDEVNNCSSVCDYLENGLIFENLTTGETSQLIFGISWVVDLFEDDNRTWLASDPSFC